LAEVIGNTVYYSLATSKAAENPVEEVVSEATQTPAEAATTGNSIVILYP
jgi:hypothetical protein